MLERTIGLIPSVFFLLISLMVANKIYKARNKERLDFKDFEGFLTSLKSDSSFVSLFLLYCVQFPILEELLFRAPLIVLFGSVSNDAWAGILICSGIFGFIHFFNKPVGSGETVNEEKIDLFTKSDYKGLKLLLKCLKVFVMILPGLLFGYIAVRYQSVILSTLAHFAWNFILFCCEAALSK